MQVKKESFQIKGQDGKPMGADLTYREEPNVKLVVYAHGINGFKDWGGTNLLAERFAKAGLAFLKFNFSHNGTTPESPIEFTDLEAYKNDNYSIRQEDLKNVIDFVFSKNLPLKVSEITLIGHSRGGTDAILYAPTDKRVSKLISWAAPCEAKTPWQHWETEKLLEWKIKGIVYRENGRTKQQMPIGYQLYEDYQKNRRRLDVEVAARKISIPWLIGHGEDDEAVFVKNAYDLKQWQPQAQVCIIENTGHTFGRAHPWRQNGLPKATETLVRHSVEFIK